MTFRVGQEFSLIESGRGSWHAEEGSVLPADCPVYGAVYTICGIDDFGGELWLLFAEIPGPYSFEACRFRPVVDRKAEVSFTMGADPESEKFDNRRKVRERSC